MNTACQLRAMIRNDEALVEHFNAQLQGEDEATGAQRLTLLLRRGIAMGRMAAHRDHLSTLSPATESTVSESSTTADSGLELQPTGAPDRPVAGE